MRAGARVYVFGQNVGTSCDAQTVRHIHKCLRRPSGMSEIACWGTSKILRPRAAPIHGCEWRRTHKS